MWLQIVTNRIPLASLTTTVAARVSLVCLFWAAIETCWFNMVVKNKTTIHSFRWLNNNENILITIILHFCTYNGQHVCKIKSGRLYLSCHYISWVWVYFWIFTTDLLWLVFKCWKRGGWLENAFIYQVMPVKPCFLKHIWVYWEPFKVSGGYSGSYSRLKLWEVVLFLELTGFVSLKYWENK